MKKEEIEKLVEEMSEHIKEKRKQNRLELMLLYGNKWREEYRRLEIDREQRDYEIENSRKFTQRSSD